jgi:Glutathione S-transferase, C-terminal domain
MKGCRTHPVAMSIQQLSHVVSPRFLKVPSAVEGTLSTIRRFLCGDQVTEADVRLFPTLFRFDHIYYNRFLLNRTMIRDSYPALQVQVMQLAHLCHTVLHLCTGQNSISTQLTSRTCLRHALTDGWCTCRGGCRTSGLCQVWQLRATLTTASGATLAGRATTSCRWGRSWTGHEVLLAWAFYHTPAAGLTLFLIVNDHRCWVGDIASCDLGHSDSLLYLVYH